MTFSTLSSTYQLYKQDTDSVAGWLASTAKSLGFSLAPASDALNKKPATSGRLKGKARAEAKKQAAASASASASATKKAAEKSTGPKYIISIKEFVPLAEYVAAKSTVVPVTVGSTIDRVITARSAFSGQLKKHGKAISEASDLKHQYFIGVLEKVREVLKPLMLADASKTNKPSEDNLSNRFAGLAVYEPSQEFLDAPPVQRPAVTRDDNAVYEAEQDTTFESAIFALTAVINDMNTVRSRIEWTWSNYRDGKFDLATAAIATNTAIDLVRNMTEDIMPLLNAHGGLGEMLMKFHILQCYMKGWSKRQIFVEGDDNFNYETYDDGTFIGSYRLLEAFVDVLDPHHLPMYKEGMYGYWDPASDRSRKLGWQKFEDDRALLMPFFTELVTAVRGTRGWPVKDEFLRGMEELAKTGKVPFYLVFATQVFLDITYTLGSDIQMPFRTLVDQTSMIDNDIAAHFEFHAKLKIKTWPASNDMMLKELQTNIKWIGKDALLAIQNKMYLRAGIEIPERESHRIFRMSPVICGLFLHHFRARHRDAGLAVANVWGSIQYSEHLYNALAQEKMLHGRWQDMEIVNAIFDRDSFFVGGEAPTTPPDYFKKFCLQVGTSAAAMVRGRRKNTPMESRTGPRCLKEGAPVLSKFKERYVANSGQVDFTPEYVSQIIELSMFETEGSEEDGSLMVLQIDDPEKIKEKKKLQHQKSQKRMASGRPNLSVEELVKHLVFALQAETLEYTFPYLHMHRWCWRVLRAVKDKADPVLRQLYTPAYLENESQLPFVIGWIFAALSGMDGISDRRPLQLAAEAVNTFIETDASRFINDEVMTKIYGMPVQFLSED